MKKNAKTIFICQTCAHESPKWMGKCPGCGEWDSLVEKAVAAGPARAPSRDARKRASEPTPIDSIGLDAEERLYTGISELDRVLGGGLVPGSMVLIGGDPGVGKSTLMLQTLYGLGKNHGKVLYVSGEESIRQIRMRGNRLSTICPEMLVVSEIDLEAILSMLESGRPAAVAIDSIQTMFNPDLTSAPGSVSQVRESTVRLMLMAKRTGIPVFLVGHVTKDGAIAGPKLLEHIVDTVLYFEGDRNHVFRILRAVKNRFGSTNEIGVFEMNAKG
ncbi:MAG: DNA repair protein RadA, partial [Desulfobacterales bacterium]|nr:DNA repair protein RadA [Desulfobacterales bacterium]